MENDYDPNEQWREVFAHFGLALYLSQVLEHTIVNFLVLLESENYKANIRRKEWGECIDSLYGQQFRNTLGSLIGTLRKSFPIPADIENEMCRALEKRNWLAHRYFRERVTHFSNKDGRDRMIAELQATQKMFKSLDDKLENILEPHWRRRGVSPELVAEEIERLLHEIQEGGSTGDGDEEFL